MDKDKIRKIMDTWLGTKRVYLLYAATTLSCWSLESFLDTYVHKKGGDYWVNLFPLNSGDELRMRFFFVFILLLFFWTVHRNTVHTLDRIREEKRAKEKIRKSGEQFKEFSASVIHDLKSPGIALEGFSQYLLKNFADKLGKKGKMICQNILQSARSVSDLTKTINEYVEIKEYPRKIEETSTKEILDIIGNEFSIRMALRNISWNCPRDLPTINADRNSLIRIFRNLVDNALKYGGDNLSEIKITYRMSEMALHVFSVIDNGGGIKLKNPEKAFRRYETSSTDGNGTGLGLAIVKEIAEQHGGKAWLDKKSRQRGTCIFFSIDEYFAADEDSRSF